MLFNARRIIKEREKELEQLKGEMKRSGGKVESLRVFEASPTMANSREREVRSEMTQKGEKAGERGG